MHYSASRVKQDYGATGILYDLGSVYEGLSRITDKRKARGKIYRIETILMIIVLAKLRGERDSGMGKTSRERNQGADAVEEATDAKLEYLSAAACRWSMPGRGRENGGDL